jgi:hypothetical protein
VRAHRRLAQLPARGRHDLVDVRVERLAIPGRAQRDVDALRARGGVGLERLDRTRGRADQRSLRLVAGPLTPRTGVVSG